MTMNLILPATTAEWYKSSDISMIHPSIHTMPTSDTATHRSQALALL